MSNVSNKAIQKLSLQSSVLLERQSNIFKTLQDKVEALSRSIHTIEDELQTILNNLHFEMQNFNDDFRTIRKEVNTINQNLKENENSKLKYTILTDSENGS